jgi:hypothetical protein
MRMARFVPHGAGVCVIGAMALIVAGSAAGAPLPSSTAQLRSAVAPAVAEARWWGRRRYYTGRRYGWRRYGSGCHMSGGYHRPSLCW